MGQLLYLLVGSDNNLEYNLKFYKILDYVLDYCYYQLIDIVVDLLNCVLYVNCFIGIIRFGEYKLECFYFKFYDIFLRICKNFDEVECNGRKILMIFCEYQ